MLIFDKNTTFVVFLHTHSGCATLIFTFMPEFSATPLRKYEWIYSLLHGSKGEMHFGIKIKNCMHARLKEKRKMFLHDYVKILLLPRLFEAEIATSVYITEKNSLSTYIEYSKRTWMDSFASLCDIGEAARRTARQARFNTRKAASRPIGSSKGATSYSSRTATPGTASLARLWRCSGT